MNFNDFETSRAVYTTTNYSLFKKLLGNRDVSPERIAKIRKSIEQRGYISSPITVNENLEIIDGQGRAEALQQLSMPVEFVVQEGLTIEDCVAMNINSTNWSTVDYIRSYAERGNEDYIQLEGIIQSFQLPLTVVLAAIRGNVGNGASNGIVKSGRFHAERWQYDTSRSKLAYLERVGKHCKKSKVLLAFLFCMQVKGCDKDRLLEVAEGHSKDIEKRAKVEDICEAIEDKYNYKKASHTRIYFKSEYKKYCLESNAGYSTRWGEEDDEGN